MPIEQLTKAWNAAMKAEEPFAVKQVQTIPQTSDHKTSQNTIEPVHGF